MRRVFFGAAVALCLTTAWREPRNSVGFEVQRVAGSLPAQVKVTSQHVAEIYNQFGEAEKALAR